LFSTDAIQWSVFDFIYFYFYKNKKTLNRFYRGFSVFFIMEEEELFNLCQYVRNSLPHYVILVDIFQK
jgi:hypothetical protein